MLNLLQEHNDEACGAIRSEEVRRACSWTKALRILSNSLFAYAFVGTTIQEHIMHQVWATVRVEFWLLLAVAVLVNVVAVQFFPYESAAAAIALPDRFALGDLFAIRWCLKKLSKLPCGDILNCLSDIANRFDTMLTEYLKRVPASKFDTLSDADVFYLAHALRSAKGILALTMINALGSTSKPEIRDELLRLTNRKFSIFAGERKKATAAAAAITRQNRPGCD